MPALTYDGRSFQIDGRRIWIVSGSLHYARIPREHWEERIHAAKQAGLNTIDVPVFWARHETRAGHFDFSGDNDLRQFVQLIAQAGLYCILRPGPYIGEDWDFGGLPAWLTTVKDVRFRAGGAPFLEACSRYLNAVADKVRDLQVTSAGKAGPGGVGGGPIILVQNESQWNCGDDKQAELYLADLNRYLREAGFTVPIINSNNLWQTVEGEIECWTGSGDLLATVRQLAHVRPDRPRIVIEFDVGEQPTWGDAPPPVLAPATLEQRLAEILAATGQFNIHPFHGGTNFGFSGGRLADAAYSGAGFATASRNHGAPLTEAGLPSSTFAAVRRICTFASRFARVFANLDPSYQPVVAAPATTLAAKAGSTGKKAQAPDPQIPPSVIHASGTQGSIAFVFGHPTDGETPGQSVELLLPNGTTLPVEIGIDGVTWCVFDAFLGGRAKLDYCNLSPFAVVGKVLVIYGRPGAEARLSINGSPLVAEVPKPKNGVGLPELIKHEGCVVVIATRDQLEQIHLTDDTVYVGAAGLSTALQPFALQGARNVTKISGDAEVSTVHAGQPPSVKNGHHKVAVSEWSLAISKDYADGTSPRYAAIDGPADLTSLGCHYGYGWYRCRLKASSAGKVHAMFPRGGDRLHVFGEGEELGVAGRGPGASSVIDLPLRKGENTLVILADNLGRLSAGANLGDLKGVFGGAWEVKPVKPGKPTLKQGEPLDVLEFRSPVWGVQSGDLTLSERLTWTIAHKKKHPLLLHVGAFPARALVVVNDKPAAFIDQGGHETIILNPEQLKNGANQIQLAVVPEAGLDSGEKALSTLADLVHFYEGEDEITSGAEWAFARWEPPRASAFQKPKGATRVTGPVWWKATFRPHDAHTPMYIDLSGMTKGQMYVNGRHVSRYFVATADHKPVQPQSRLYIPPCWMRPGDDNELLLFDEHGGNPAKVHFAYEP